MGVSRHSCASAFCSAALLAAACSNKAADSSATAGPRGDVPVERSGASTDSIASFPLATAALAARPAVVMPDPYLSGRPVAAKSIGHTSYVLKVKLENGLAAAYKPRSKLPLGDRRYRGEIAAYRLGRALGLNNVPCAMPRTFAAGDLRAAFATKEDAEEFERKALVDPTGTVRGALIPWIEHYEEIPLEKRAARVRWERWLTDPRAQIPPEGRALARSISTMLTFDYMIANWDRWSGGNVVRDGATGTLLFVDNDGAFYELPPQSLARQAELLRRVLHFSRSFVTGLRGLDASALRDIFGKEGDSEFLLPDATIEQVEQRREAVLGFVDAAAARWGEAATLSFE